MKYVPSALIGQLSRSQGSTTASRNRYGSYFRNRVMPVNPNTSAQSTVRNNFQELSSGYRALTEEQRSAWRELGNQMIRSGSLAENYSLAGLNAYISVNTNLRTIGATLVTSPPTLTEVATVTTATLTVDSDPTMSLAFTPTPLGAGDHLVIRASAPVSAGKTFVPRGALRQVVVTAAAGTSPQNITEPYQAIFGEIGAGQIGAKIFAEVLIINAEGFAGTPLRISDIVEAAV